MFGNGTTENTFPSVRLCVVKFSLLFSFFFLSARDFLVFFRHPTQRAHTLPLKHIFHAFQCEKLLLGGWKMFVESFFHQVERHEEGGWHGELFLLSGERMRKARETLTVEIVYHNFLVHCFGTSGNSCLLFFSKKLFTICLQKIRKNSKNLKTTSGRSNTHDIHPFAT